MSIRDDERQELERLRIFYDSVYYCDRPTLDFSRHWQRVASRIGIRPGSRVLDVACGDGSWLAVCKERGAFPYGVDLSRVAIEQCRIRLPDAEVSVQAVESLPFDDEQFDIVSCLGALEHMVNPHQALAEMVRVAKPSAAILLLVPNADFLARRFRLFGGTEQAAIKEEVRSLQEWTALFECANLNIRRCWRDVHLLAWDWLSFRGWSAVPFRLALAALIALLPLKWQYQVYFLCQKTVQPDRSSYPESRD